MHVRPSEDVLALTELLDPMTARLLDATRVHDERKRVHRPVVEQERHLRWQRANKKRASAAGPHGDPGRVMSALALSRKV